MWTYFSCEPTCFFLFQSAWVELSSFTSIFLTILLLSEAPTLQQPQVVQGEVTHIGAVQTAATGVKMWSNGQATSRGAVKRSSDRFRHLY